MSEKENLNAQARILQAARDLMWNHGYAGTTTKMIAEKAEVNEVTIFRIFKNKRNILMEMIGHLDATRENPVNDILEKEFKDPEEFLDQIIFLFFDKFVKVKDIFWLCLKEVGEGNPEISRVIMRFLMLDSERVVKKLRDTVGESTIKDSELQIALFMFMNTLISGSILKLIMGEENLPYSLEEMSSMAKKVLIQGLR